MREISLRVVQPVVLSGVFSIFVVPDALAEDAGSKTSEVEAQSHEEKAAVSPYSPTPLSVSDFQSSTTVDGWMAQIAQAQVQITDVQVTATKAGLAITSETTEPLEAPSTSTVGNAMIADILNAVLLVLSWVLSA